MGCMAMPKKRPEVDGHPRKKPPCKARKFPAKLAQLLRKSGLSQSELARRTGIFPSLINQWLDDNGTPIPRHFVAIARAFGVTVDFLLDDAQDEYHPVLSDDEVRVVENARTLGIEEAMKRLLAVPNRNQPQGFTIPPPGSSGGSRQSNR